jgi:LPXTG-site transpeptidase (sortase) family protein
MRKQNVITVLIGVVRSIVLALTLMFVFAAFEPALAVGEPARLVIPAIEMDRTIMPVGIRLLEINGQTYGIWNVLDSEVGWHNLSASLGQVGNTVLSGHSDVKARVFQDLHRVNLGDEIVAFSGEQQFRYIVTEKFLVREKGVSLETRIKNAQLIAPTQDERLTLVTCARPGATHRLVVIALPMAIGRTMVEDG